LLGFGIKPEERFERFEPAPETFQRLKFSKQLNVASRQLRTLLVQPHQLRRIVFQHHLDF
jgi:hypothetical protein